MSSSQATPLILFVYDKSGEVNIYGHVGKYEVEGREPEILWSLPVIKFDPKMDLISANLEVENMSKKIWPDCFSRMKRVWTDGSNWFGEVELDPFRGPESESIDGEKTACLFSLNNFQDDQIIQSTETSQSQIVTIPSSSIYFWNGKTTLFCVFKCIVLFSDVAKIIQGLNH